MKKTLAALAAAALSLPLAVAALPADAAARCTVVNYSPRSVTLGFTPKVVKFSKPAVTGCTLEGWSISGDLFYVYDTNPEELFYTPYSNSDAGKKQDVVVEVYNPDYEITTKVFADSFTLRRNTGWDKTNASPEPVKKGAKITVQGRLRIADWPNDRYVGFTNRGISVEFAPKGSTTYKQIKTTTSGAGGYVKTTVTAASDGSWRLRYGGNTYAGNSVMPGDFVDVK
jgi:hypothetical protein